MPNSIAVSRTPDSTISAARAFGVVNGFLERDPTGEIITAVRRFPAKQAQWAEFPGWTHADLVAAFTDAANRTLSEHRYTNTAVNWHPSDAGMIAYANAFWQALSSPAPTPLNPPPE